MAEMRIVALIQMFLAESNSAAWLGIEGPGRDVGKISAPLESRT